MAIIQAVVCKNTSYVFHMLSVARVGYDNAYGAKYRSCHSVDDIAQMQQYHDLLRVSGGKHIGQLYALLVALPASLDDYVSLDVFYDYIVHLFRALDRQDASLAYASWLTSLPDRPAFGLDIRHIPLVIFAEFQQAILVLCDIFKRNQDIFTQTIWPEEQELLRSYVDQLNAALAQHACQDRWQELLGCQWNQDVFHVIICNSLLDGPQAIDIASDRDVFQRSSALQPLCEFISHEFGIYMLKQLLHGILDPGNILHWKPIEGIAVLYNQLVWDNADKHWHADVALVNYYKRLREDNPSISVAELFSQGLSFYNQPSIP